MLLTLDFASGSGDWLELAGDGSGWLALGWLAGSGWLALDWLAGWNGWPSCDHPLLNRLVEVVILILDAIPCGVVLGWPFEMKGFQLKIEAGPYL